MYKTSTIVKYQAYVEIICTHVRMYVHTHFVFYTFLQTVNHFHSITQSGAYVRTSYAMETSLKKQFEAVMKLG